MKELFDIELEIKRTMLRILGAPPDKDKLLELQLDWRKQTMAFDWKLEILISELPEAARKNILVENRVEQVLTDEQASFMLDAGLIYFCEHNHILETPEAGVKAVYHRDYKGRLHGR